MAVFGAGCYMFFVWLALQELGKIIGSDSDEQIGRANKLGVLSYFTSIIVISLAGAFNPYGFTSLPVVAGLLAVIGGMSPLAWMMQWFQAKMFVKVPNQPLQIHRQWAWTGGAVVVVFVYAVILGRTLYF